MYGENKMDSLKIQHIKIEGIGGIINLELDFKDGLNLICGTNRNRKNHNFRIVGV